MLRKTKLTRRIKQDLTRYIHKQADKGEDAVEHIQNCILQFCAVRGYNLNLEEALAAYLKYEENRGE